MNNRTFLVVTVGGALAMAAFIWLGWNYRHLDCRDFSEAEVIINNKSYRMALADTDAERIQGLQACHKIPQDSGMLFLLESRQTPSFWMKGMAAPIDIVWIRDGEVVGLNANLEPLTNQTDDPQTYAPPVPVDAVIETAAHQAAVLGLIPGAKVEY